MKLIKTEQYLLLTDEEAEIKKGYYLTDKLTICRFIKGDEKYVYSLEAGSNVRKNSKKLIAYYPLTKEAKELDLPLLPTLDENPYKETEDYQKWLEDSGTEKSNAYQLSLSFLAGFKQARTKKFSLEDIKKAIEMAREDNGIDCEGNYSYTEEEIIQSLSTQQSMPKEFIVEYETIQTTKKEDYKYQNGNSNLNYEQRFKTITNSEGKEELIGTYKY